MQDSPIFLKLKKYKSKKQIFAQKMSKLEIFENWRFPITIYTGRPRAHFPSDKFGRKREEKRKGLGSQESG